MLRVYSIETNNYSASTGALNSAESDKNRRRPRRIRQNRCMCVFSSTVVENFEVSMCSRTACVNNPLRNTFVIKPMDFLSCELIFKKRRTNC
jgi:hypothetical protein